MRDGLCETYCEGISVFGINSVNEYLKAIKIEKLLSKLFFLETLWVALMDRGDEGDTLP